MDNPPPTIPLFPRKESKRGDERPPPHHFLEASLSSLLLFFHPSSFKLLFIRKNSPLERESPPFPSAHATFPLPSSPFEVFFSSPEIPSSPCLNPSKMLSIRGRHFPPYDLLENLVSSDIRRTFPGSKSPRPPPLLILGQDTITSK